MEQSTFEVITSQGSWPWLSALIALPAIVALLLGVIPVLRNWGREIALVASLVELVVAIFVAVKFDWSNSSAYQLMESHEWIPQIGVSWSVAVNALGLVMILLAAALVPIVLLASRKEDEDARQGGSYAALILGLEAFMMVIFAAFDVVLFYLAFEAMLIPLFFMVGRFGFGENRQQAAVKTLVYSLLGGLAMLGGIVAIYATAGSTNEGELFRYDTLATLLPESSFALQMTVFITFAIAFAIKAPMVPVHTWLPDAAAAARPGTSVLLVGVLDKIGTFGMIVFLLGFTSDAVEACRPVLLVLAIISILWGGFAANGQENLLRLISFTSVSHFGFMVLGIFIGNSIALNGAMYYMVAHGISIAGMFLISGFLIRRGGTTSVKEYGGMQRVVPVIAGTWLVVGLASIAMPGLSGFIPEYLVLMGTFSVSPWAAVISVFGVVIAALYVLMPYQRIFTGAKNPKLEEMRDMTGLEKLSIAPLLVAMVVLGLWSAPLSGSFEQVAESAVIEAVAGSADESSTDESGESTDETSEGTSEESSDESSESTGTEESNDSSNNSDEDEADNSDSTDNAATSGNSDAVDDAATAGNAEASAASAPTAGEGNSK